ncbi:MAG TPA: hypothetical protein VFQ36_19425, partial [Ktedonobacteraceae bacterium]|nr:hypothetical protein [Ktedonobacteraceae bacterium]
FLPGDVERARHMALRSMEDAQEHELTRALARSQRLLGRILAASGHPAGADVYFEKALGIFSRHEMRLDYARALNGYGVTLLQRSVRGEPAFTRGLAYLQEAHTIFVACKATIDITWVERILNHYNYENARV